MRHIVQEHDSGCVSACVAMLTGKSFWDAFNKIISSTTQCGAVLTEVIPSVLDTMDLEWRELPPGKYAPFEFCDFDESVLFIGVFNEHYGHAVIYSRFVTYDPLCRYPKIGVSLPKFSSVGGYIIKRQDVLSKVYRVCKDKIKWIFQKFQSNQFLPPREMGLES